MFFLGQINCADLQGLPGAERLPASGLLAFFGDHDAVMSGTRHGDSPVAVYHWPDLRNLVPAKPPLEVQIVFPLCGISFWSFIDLPDPFSDIIESVAPKEGNGHYLDVGRPCANTVFPVGWTATARSANCSDGRIGSRVTSLAWAILAKQRQTDCTYCCRSTATRTEPKAQNGEIAGRFIF